MQTQSAFFMLASKVDALCSENGTRNRLFLYNCFFQENTSNVLVNFCILKPDIYCAKRWLIYNKTKVS